jgi:predicted outer membrane repeat protein
MDARCSFSDPVKAFRLVLLAGVLLGWAPAYAATACVNTPLQLALVLIAAESNGEDDLIKVEVGTYLLGGELDYITAPTETHDLTVFGGWAPGCLALASSGSSVLDGQHAARALYVVVGTNSRVNIRNLTFQNGNPAQYAGGASYMSGSTNSILDVESSIFINNQCATTIGGAIYMSAGGIYLKNSLFIANSGNSTVYIANGYLTELNNNTIVGNQLPNHVGPGAALLLAGGGQYYYLSNNILWNNEGIDLYDQSGIANFYNNDIGVKGGLPPAAESNGLSVDPDFDGFFSVVPAPGSPLVNAGLDSPLGGIGGTDLAGNTRLVGKHVDIGAYETDVLFRGLFE